MIKTWETKFILPSSVQQFAVSLQAIEGFADNLRNTPWPPGARERVERLNIIRAIKGTTGIEGNEMTEDEIGDLIDSNVDPEAVSREERENLNAQSVMDHLRAQETGKQPRIDEALVKEIHRISTNGIPDDLNVPGAYRKDFVYSGGFQFPDPKDVPRLMNDFIAFINSSEMIEQHPVVRAILAHFYFVHVHPFGDGNGRVGRALEAFLLYQSGFAVAGFYSLANFYYRNRKEYIRQLNDAKFKHDGDVTAFLAFALNGFLYELTDISKMVLPYMKAIRYQQHVDRLADKGVIDLRVATALKTIAIMQDGITPQEFVKRLPNWTKKLYRGKSERTVSHDLTAMRKSGLIVERDGRIFPDLDIEEVKA